MGELAGDALVSLEAQLSEVYGRHISERTEWGGAEEELRSELESELRRTSASIADTRRGLVSGLALSGLDPSVDLDEMLKQSMQRAKTKKLPLEGDQMAMLQSLLEGWCAQIDRYLGSMKEVESVDHSAGPQGIIDAWRTRLQKLISVTEQLKRRDVRTTFTLLTAVTKGPPERIPPTLFPLLRRWKELDIAVTEAANEAKDNVKYLATLDKFVAPLHKGTPQAIMDALPALMSSIKMIHTIARYFNTGERMGDLFTKITHAIIAACKNYILDVDRDAGDNLWRKNFEALMPRLEICLKVNELYQESFRLTREKLASQPLGKQFDFPEGPIFGRIDAFCRRILKLIDLFSTIGQYRALEAHQLEGLAPLIREFDGLVASLQARRHNLLAFTSTDFDRDYVEFNVSVDRLEVKLQSFIQVAFASIKSVSASLDLLLKFETVLKRETLTAELQEKAIAVFAAFGRELELVQAIYEEQKQVRQLRLHDYVVLRCCSCWCFCCAARARCSRLCCCFCRMCCRAALTLRRRLLAFTAPIASCS